MGKGRVDDGGILKTDGPSADVFIVMLGFLSLLY
jgi:hypothetical protein